MLNDGVFLHEIKEQKSSVSDVGLTHRTRKINRSSVIRDKIKRLTHLLSSDSDTRKQITTTKSLPLQNIHIFYSIPVNWFSKLYYQSIENNISINDTAKSIQPERMQQNIAFYPLHGLYNTEKEFIQLHLQNIKSLGIGVLSKINEIM